MKDQKKLLSKSGLKETQPREIILETFRASDHALSYQEIEERTSHTLDKVTIYRTLRTFEEHGIVHVVHDENKILRYALCHADCNPANHHDEHLHFKCKACDQIYCLNQIEVPKPRLPDGYSANNWYLLISGICDRCN